MEIFTPDVIPIVSDIPGAEGPVFDRGGNMYAVAPYVKDPAGKPAGEVLKIDIANKQSKLLCAPKDGSYGGIPVGCQCDREGNIWVADMRLGLLKVTSDGHFKQVTRRDSTYRQMQGCNDCILDYDENLWITAPGRRIAPDAHERSSKENPFGSIYCYSITDDVMTKVDSGFAYCNGIAVQHSDDGRPLVLIVAETQTKSLIGYDITGPAKVDNKRVWGTLPGGHDGGPDGMDFDNQGNLLVANWGSGYIDVFGPEGGTPVCRVKLPFKEVSNLHFMPRSKQVFVTEHDTNALWMFEWKCEGKPQYCEL